MKIQKIINDGWECFKHKVSNGLLSPANEKMMQLQLAQIYQSMAFNYEYEESESIKVLLEIPVTIRRNIFRSIDIVLSHTHDGRITHYPIELKCFRLLTRAGTGRRGAQNLGMYDYWEDIVNIENYSKLRDYSVGFQFTLTDDAYYVETEHRGSQVAVYSTNNKRNDITGILKHPIASRKGKIILAGKYSMSQWEKLKNFWFIKQQSVMIG